MFCLKCGAPVKPSAEGDASEASYPELQGSLSEALARERATGEILRVIGSSPTDAQPVFETIARSGVSVCAALGCAVFVIDGDMLRVAATHGVRPERVERFRAEYPIPLSAEIDTAQTVRQRHVVHLADIEHNANATASDIEYARLAGYRTRLMVPMVRGDRALGLIAVTREDPTPFPDQLVELLKHFADQAVIAIENVRLFTETREALERQTATSEILRVISSSPTDTQPVFDTIAANAARLCAARDAQVLRVEGDVLRLVSAYGSPSMPPVRSISRGHAVGRAVIDRQTIHVRDMAQAVMEFPETSAPQHGVESVLAVPLLRNDVAVGVIRISRTQIQPFTDAQITLLQTFADQAVIAIENVRLFTELQEKNRALTVAHAEVTETLEQQTATSEILRAISSSPTDLQPVLDTVGRSAARFCGAYDACIFRLAGDHLRLDAHHGPVAQPDGFLLPVVKGTVGGRTVLERRVIHVADLPAETAEFPEAAANARRLGFRTILSVPLLREGVAIGAIQLRRPESIPFTDKQVSLLQAFADQAVIAVENVRLFTELQARNRELTEALDQQTATSNVLKVISRSTFDLEAVLTTLIENATRLCGAHQGFIFRAHGERYHLAADYNASPTFREWAAATPIRPGDGRIVGRVAVEGRVVQIVDAQGDAAWRAGNAGAPGVSDVRALLGVPMLREGVLIGVFAMWRLEPRPFTDKQIELVTTFADQAVIAIENVRLFTELEEKNRALTETLDQQTATSEVLRAIAHTQTDVQPVFDTIVRSAARLLHAANAAVFLTDGTMLYHPANHGSSPEALAAVRAQYPRRLDADTTPGRAILTRSVVQVPDIEAPSAGEHVRQVGRLLGFQSVVAVPMLRDGEAVGAINVSRREPGGLSDAEVELLKTFADQAVIAIENVRLFKELEARTAALTRSVEQLTALGEVGRAVSSTLDLETVLTTIVTRAVQLSRLDGGVVFEYEGDAEEFVHRAATETGGALAEARRATRVRKGEGVVGRTAITLEPAQVPDITVPGAYESRLRENLITSGVRAVLAVPMVGEDRLIGCLVVSRNQPGDFPAETIELLRTFATQSALAIQNARLFHEIEDKSRQLEAASRHKSEFLANMSHELRTPLNAVIGFSEVLLQRMFGDLNAKQDEYLKDIYASGQHLLSLINDILDLSKIEAGRMELAPAPFHLPTALDNAVTLVKERAARHGIALELDLDPRVGELVGDERKVKQVLVNLLSNAVKFTPEGGQISLKAVRRDGMVEISVTDTGIGIAPEDQAAIFEEFRQVGSDERRREGTGLGLTLAKKFVDLHGGRIWVESELGRGATFTFTLPLR
jgi:GAF domain-containing protein